MTDDLMAFLKACVDEDERVAIAGSQLCWTVDGSGPNEFEPHLVVADHTIGAIATTLRRSDAEHIARHDPARVLAEVAAKRRIIDLHEGNHECSTYDHNGQVDNCTWVTGGCSTLRLLASVYAGLAVGVGTGRGGKPWLRT